MGQADFASGNYRAARSDFQSALHLKPDDPSVQRLLDLSDEVMELDPTQRGLGAAEKYRRSLKLVELTLQEVASCARDQDLLDRARKLLKQPLAPARQADASETNLDLAETLWQVRKTDCEQTPIAADDPLALVFKKVAQ